MTSPAVRPRLHYAGDGLVLVELEAVVSAEVNSRVVALAAAVSEARIPGVRDVVPGYRSVGVHIDPLECDVHALEAVVSHAWDIEGVEARDRAPRTIVIPVCYGGPHGPDLDDVAAFAGCAAEEVVARHTARLYRVYMVGFVPGFAYLGTVDPTIAMPRRATPRVAVPAGSVGIAGSQTGVYPVTSPGGWRLIGRTSTAMFDVTRQVPALLAPGDSVRFVAVPADQWSAPA